MVFKKAKFGSSEHIKKILVSRRSYVGKNNPNYGKNVSDLTRKKMSVSIKRALSEGKMRYWTGKKLSEKHRKKLSEKATGRVGFFRGKKRPELSGSNHYFYGKKRTEEQKKQYSITMKKQFKNGRVVWNKGVPRTVSEKKKISVSQQKNWKDPNFVKRVAERKNIRPNKSELFIKNILDRFFFNEWKFCGDLSFMVDGKNPDFMNVNGQKKLIEVFGDYWHKPEDELKRISHFARFGFETLVVWGHELKDGIAEQKIIEFCKNGGEENSTETKKRGLQSRSLAVWVFVL